MLTFLYSFYAFSMSLCTPFGPLNPVHPSSSPCALQCSDWLRLQHCPTPAQQKCYKKLATKGSCIYLYSRHPYWVTGSPNKCTAITSGVYYLSIWTGNWMAVVFGGKMWCRLRTPIQTHQSKLICIIFPWPSAKGCCSYN